MSQDSQERRTSSPFYSQLEVTAGESVSQPQASDAGEDENAALLRDLLQGQDRTNELLEELVSAMAAAQRQRATELQQWRKANPELARACRRSAEALSRVQIEFLNRMTDEISDTAEELMEGDFMLSEFVDRFGPRLAHLNGVIQVLAQLSTAANPADSNSQ